MTDFVEISGKTLAINRRGFVHLCSLRDEYYEFIEDPVASLPQLRQDLRRKADVFTFIQAIADPKPRFSFHLEFDSAAVLFLSTFDHWWKKQINDKTRNMVRKAQKAGLEVRLVKFGDELVRDIRTVYDESPIRQGKRFWHYGKDFETLRREHGTFLDQSEFFGAYHDGQFIGFIKLVHGCGVSSLMNIISLISHRNKAPNNALIAKAVEVCAQKGVVRLQYGTGNSGSIGEFKKHNGFQEVLVPRYFVPLTAKGAVALRLGLHRRFDRYFSKDWRARLLRFRAKWVDFRFAKRTIRSTGESVQV